MWRYSETSRGTTDETASPSIWSKPMPRSAEQVVHHHRQLVPGRLAIRGEAPVLDQLGAVEGADVGLGVADVDA